MDAQRDVDYAAVVQTLTIPAGQTTGTTTMTVTPVNNNDEDEPRAFTVNARVGNNPVLSTGILITDDDTTSDSITLTVSPTEINEDAGATTVTVTGTLQGKEFPGNIVVPLIIDADPKDEDAAGEATIDVEEATRDLDYTAVLGSLVIAGGSTEGTKTITITPISDSDDEEGDEIIRVTSSGKPSVEDEDGDLQELDVGYADITLKDSDAEADADDGEETATPTDPTKPSFASAEIADQTYMVGTAIDSLVLPEAAGGEAPITYSVSTLPAGLSFDTATRTLTGTPTTATDRRGQHHLHGD